MKLALTDKATKVQVIIESDSIDIMEVDPVDGLGAHIVLASGLGRKVIESVGSILAISGCVAPSTMPAIPVSVGLLKK